MEKQPKNPKKILKKISMVLDLSTPQYTKKKCLFIDF